MMGWLGEAKVSCSLCHQGIQLILAYSWARPTVLAAVKVKGGCFYYALPFSIGGEGGRGGAYSITAVICTSVPSVRPVRNTNGFCAISFEKIDCWIEFLY